MCILFIDENWSKSPLVFWTTPTPTPLMLYKVKIPHKIFYQYIERWRFYLHVTVRTIGIDLVDSVERGKFNAANQRGYNVLDPKF